ncbi:unnamed protein product [Ectocarpus sp. CCAP 1310/34]|nr:unnamed protein product [Ectocarpus sp. CCAP 1310/34]
MSAGTGFPYILYDLLNKESPSIVMWTSTGTAFGIRDMASFRQDVLTCYFKHNKFSSFQRQLNLYGFRKVVKGRESGCYMHPSFLRDSPEKLTEVKRGVVPPCPPCYSRKIYGSGPRFMSQEEGSDSEPELVVQARGHWEKSLGPTDVATHMRLGEMHMSAAALGAARAQIQGDGAGTGSHAAAAAAAAAVHHLQAAQAHIQGVPGGDSSRGPGGVVVGMPEMDAARGLPPPPAEMDGGGGGKSPFLRASSSGNVDRSSAQQPQPHMQQHRQEQPQYMQQQHQMQHRFGGASPMAEQSSPHDDARGGGDAGSLGYMPPLAAVGGREEGMPMGAPTVEEVGSSARGMGDFRPGQTPMVLSLSRLLENLEHTLEAPLAEEMYTPIGQRNSFCAQMVNIAQVLEEDPSLQQGAEGESRSRRCSYLAQKRRSSVTELAYYLQDMLDEGESNRMITNTPGWTLPPPMPSAPGSLEGAFPSREGSGSGNRVTFKRTAPEDFESYGEYGMAGNVGGGGGGGGGGSSRQAAGGMGAPQDASNEVGPGSFNLKRARGGPQMAERFPSGREGPVGAGGGGGGGGGGVGRHGRRMSEARMNAKVAASPSVVQALTCLASGLPETSDSEENTQESTAAAVGAALSLSSSSTEPQAGGGGTGVNREGFMPHKVSEERPGGEAAAAGREMPLPNPRRGSKAINDVVTKFSIDQALEQLKGEDEGGEGGGGDGGGGGGGGEDRGEPNPCEQSSDKQRASVYVLMHAIAAVDTANDEMFGEEEPLDGVETEAAI